MIVRLSNMVVYYSIRLSTNIPRIKTLAQNLEILTFKAVIRGEGIIEFQAKKNLCKRGFFECDFVIRNATDRVQI